MERKIGKEDKGEESKEGRRKVGKRGKGEE